MVSRFSAKWHWYDWIFILFAVIVIIGAIQIVAPSSGFAIALHRGFHALALGVAWVGNGLIQLAAILNQL